MFIYFYDIDTCMVLKTNNGQGGRVGVGRNDEIGKIMREAIHLPGEELFFSPANLGVHSQRGCGQNSEKIQQQPAGKILPVYDLCILNYAHP